MSQLLYLYCTIKHSRTQAKRMLLLIKNQDNKYELSKNWATYNYFNRPTKEAHLEAQVGYKEIWGCCPLGEHCLPELPFFLLKRFFIYLREKVSGGGAEGEGQGDSVMNAEPNTRARTHNAEIMTWAKIKSRKLNWLSHPGAPRASNRLVS